jgi:hypothetical protein
LPCRPQDGPVAAEHEGQVGLWQVRELYFLEQIDDDDLNVLTQKREPARDLFHDSRPLRVTQDKDLHGDLEELKNRSASRPLALVLPAQRL